MSNLNKLHNKDFRIKVRTGLDADLDKFKKTAVQGELAFTTDTYRLFATETTAASADSTLTEIQTLIAPTYLTTTATYTIDSRDRWLIYSGGGNATINLPPLSSVFPGRSITIKNRTNQTLTLSAQGTDVIFPANPGGPSSTVTIGNGQIKTVISGLNGDWNVVQSAG